ncbi:cation efflux family-domain-containing protein [Xylariomycetidae sp. FL0641]|nr:cation efflux family-domain-containing protein [Xylariomycetidae sp. FL0641]
MASVTQTRQHGGHGHKHGHGHHHDNVYLTSQNKNDAGVRITRIGLYSNLGMAIAKGVGGYMFNSKAMIADAIHSVTDLASDILTLATISFSMKPPSDTFPTGFGKIESLGSLGVSSMLLFGGIWMGYGSLLTLYGHFFLDPATAAELMSHAHGHSHGHSHGHDAASVVPSLHAAWLAAGTVAIKEWLYHATMKVARDRKSSVLASNAVHHRIDSLTGIVTLAVILGANFMQNAAWLDPVGGLLISLMVVKAGAENTVSSLMELADRSIDDEVKISVRKQAVKALVDVSESHQIEIRDVSGVKSGQNYLVDLEVLVPGSWTVEDVREVEDKIRTRVGGKVRGVRKVRVRFVPKDVATAPKFDEFISGSVSPKSSPEPEPEEENHDDHDHPKTKRPIVIRSDLNVVSEAKVDFDADFKEQYQIQKGVRINEDAGEVFCPVAMWIEAIDLVLTRLKANGCPMSEIRGISGSGQQHSSVYWSKDAEPALNKLDAKKTLIEQLKNALAYDFAPSWQDHSTQKECDDFNATLGGPEKLAQITGSAAHHRFTGTQILRMRRVRPQVYNATARISLASSFLASVLLGRIAPIDISDVTGMNLWDIAAERWHDKLLELTAGKDGVPELRKKLGDVPLDGGGSMGSISPYFVSKYGFSPECQVAPFTGDNPATILALPLRPLDAIVSLGTSTTFLMNTPNYKPDPSYHFMNHPALTSHHMFMLCYKNGGLAREKVRDALPANSAPASYTDNKTADGKIKDPWAPFNELVLSTPPLDVRKPGDPAKLGLYFPLPEIVPNVRAGTWRYTCDPKDGSNLRESDSELGELDFWPAEADARVIVESQALSMRLRSQPLVAPPPDHPGLPAQPRRIYLVGGGSLNPAIARVVGDVLGGADGVYRLDVGGNACALGGAYKAVWAQERSPGQGFHEFLVDRWREEDAIRRVDDGFRADEFVKYGNVILRLPFEFLRERYFVQHARQSPFVQQASPFEDFVIRCVRYAFAHIPPKVGRVFFSKPVALPFLRFRMLRHGFVRPPVHWNEYIGKGFRGVWIIQDPMKKPDICIYYAHGGGFAMGSSYFYLEFLLSWLGLLSEAGYTNPAIFALEYTLVPDRGFPTQLQEAIAGYEHVLSTVGDPDRVCVSGDSAGATIILSLLLHLANLSRHGEKLDAVGTWQLGKPGFAVLISPWVTLVSRRHRNTSSDYLDASHLHMYARQYARGETAVDDPLLSPGNCRDVQWWKKACPLNGIYMAYGAEEVFAPEIEDLIGFMEDNKIQVSSREERGGIHAWPVASLFLSTTPEERQKGLRDLVGQIKDNI